MRQYYEYWVAFDSLDDDDDRRIDLIEFEKGMPTMEKWGITGDAETMFNEIDTNEGGKILFIEFCSWAIKKNLDIDTDDNVL